MSLSGLNTILAISRIFVDASASDMYLRLVCAMGASKMFSTGFMDPILGLST